MKTKKQKQQQKLSSNQFQVMLKGINNFVRFLDSDNKCLNKGNFWYFHNY